MRSVLVLLGTMALTACAARTGWQRVTTRTCAADGPPRVCFHVEPDRQVVLDVGGETLVPGECARGPEDARGGSLVLRVRDGGTPGGTAKRRVHAGRGRELTVTVVDGRRGGPALKLEARTRCSWRAE